MNTTFVSSLFYAPPSPALESIVPKWSPARHFESFRQLENPRPIKSALIAWIVKPQPPVWPISTSSLDVLSVPPIHIGTKTALTLKIMSGPSDEGFMNDVDRPAKRKAITLAEVREAYEPLGDKFPPLLDLDRAADLSGYTANTLKKKLSEGAFRDSVSRGKPLLFWRDRFVLELMNRPWSSPARSIDSDAVGENDQTKGGDNEVD